MKQLSILLASVLVVSCASMKGAPGEADETIYHVYFLGGQSNMEGFGYTDDLPAELRANSSAIRIFHGKSVEDGAQGGGIGIWDDMAPGHGTGFDTDGSVNFLSDRFGPEVSFAGRLSIDTPGERIAIIKYARGGTALVDGVSGYGSWDPDYAAGNGRNQYDNALSSIASAMGTTDIDGDGVRDRLIPAGIIWMQGEADAYDNLEAATNYAENLKRLMDLLRAAFRVDDLPVVIGQIKDSGTTPETRVMRYSNEVRLAQNSFVKSDPCASLVKVTEEFGFLPDGWHYRSGDYVKLGDAFAEAVRVLRARCGGGAAP